MFYGVTRRSQPIGMCEDVCHFFAKSNRGTDQVRHEINLCIETLCAETLLGRLRDPHFKKHGVGISQIDLVGFTDTVNRMSPRLKEMVIEKWGIDIDCAKHKHLAFNPLLSIIIMRNFYLLRPGLIPPTRLERARYWKKHYNTHQGDGSVGHYLKLCADILD